MAKTMRLEHRFPASPEKVVDLILNIELQKKMYGELKYTQYAEEARKEGKLLERTLRLVPPVDVPGFIKKALGESTGYREYQTWDEARRSYTWKVVFDLSGRLSFSGKCVFKPEGDGCYRLITGEVRAGIPLIGGKLESYIVGQADDSEGKPAEWMAKYLKGA